MIPAEQLTLDGGAVPHDDVVRGASRSRMMRRPVESWAALGARALDELLQSLFDVLDRAGVAPGDAFYVSRVPPVPVSAPARGAARRSDPSTSVRAGAMVAPRTGSQRWALLVEFSARAHARYGPASGGATPPDGGLTAEEAARRISKPGAWRRVSELLKGGYIEPTGDERPTRSGAAAEVYRITEKGRDALAAGRGTT